jgi:hypothetical protein
MWCCRVRAQAQGCREPKLRRHKLTWFTPVTEIDPFLSISCLLPCRSSAVQCLQVDQSYEAVFNPIQYAVVSDTSFKDNAADKSGPTAREILEAASCTVVETRIVPDEIYEIQAVVRRWAALGEADWIITTGGTGFGRRDRTPEVGGLRYCTTAKRPM